MRQILQMSLAVVIGCFVITGASEIPAMYNIELTDNDSLVYISSESPLESNKSLLISPETEGMLLDVPANDNCADAQEIGEVQNFLANTIDATADGGNLSVFPNVWYLYTATITDQVEVSIFDPVDDVQSIGGVVTVYDGTTCPDYIDIPSPIVLQGGETLESAVPISSDLPVAYMGNFEGYVRDYPDCSCLLDYSIAGPDVVYSYTAADDDFITLTLADYETNLALVIMDENGGELACSNWNRYQDEDGNRGPAIINFPVLAGETYYLIIKSMLEDYSFEYTLMIYSPAYNMIDRSCRTSRGYTEVIFDVVEGHQYLIEVSYMTPSETTILSIRPQPDPPENDICENAQDGGVLRAGELIEYVGDNTGATSTCPLLSSHPEVWIKFTLQDTLNIKMDYCGNTSIGNYVSQSAIMTQDCPYRTNGWYYGENHPFFPPFCPNLSNLVWWENLIPGTYYYPMIVHHDFEGPYVINITGVANQRCGDEALFGQEPMDVTSNSCEFYVSDFEDGFAVMDKFEDVNGVINKITWWGASIESDGIFACDPADPYSFEIVILDFNQSMPYLPGDTVGIYNVTVNPQKTGYAVNDHFLDEKPQWKFEAILPESLEMEEGWVMIRGNDGYNGCLFAWQNSSAGGDGLIYDIIESQWTRTYDGLAFCLGYDDQVGIDDGHDDLPLTYELLQNYPNPFNATTSIRFSLKNTDDVTLSVYDIGGRLIRTLLSGSLPAGTHNLIWDGTNQAGEIVSSGVYFYRLDCSEGSYGNRMVLLK